MPTGKEPSGIKPRQATFSRSWQRKIGLLESIYVALLAAN